MPLVLGLCALLVLVGCEKQPPPTPSASTPSAGQLTTLPPPVVEAPDGGGIRVVEQGFSAMGDATGKPMVSYGIVVENTSRELAAVRTKITIRLLDGSGGTIDDLVEGAPEVTREVGAVLPGQRMGIGAHCTAPDRSGA